MMVSFYIETLESCLKNDREIFWILALISKIMAPRKFLAKNSRFLAIFKAFFGSKMAIFFFKSKISTNPSVFFLEMIFIGDLASFIHFHLAIPEKNRTS